MITGKKNIFQKALGAVTGGGITGNLGKFAALGAVTTFLTSTLGMSEEQAEEEVARDPSKYLSLYYKNLNPKASEEEVQEFVTSNTSEYAEGGRIGYAEAGPVLPNDTTQPVNPFGPKPGDFGIEDIPIKMVSNEIEIPEITEEFLEELKRRKIEDLLDQYYRFQEDYERRKDMAPTQEAAMGGRIGIRVRRHCKPECYASSEHRGASYETKPQRCTRTRFKR